MSEQEKELSKLEKELVFGFLKNEDVPLTLSLQDKPLATEAVLNSSKIDSGDAEKISASSMFPVAVPAENVEVLDQGIIIIKNSERLLNAFSGHTIRLQFYFNRVGLYFLSTLKPCSQGYAVVIPEVIKRIKESEQGKKFDLCAEIIYEAANGQKVNIKALPIVDYSLLSVPKWADVPVAQQVKAKSYLENFVRDAKNGMASPIGNGLHLIPVARYLSEPLGPEIYADRTRTFPINLIYFDDDKIVFASRIRQDSLQLENDYTVELSFDLVQNTMLKRKVRAEITVEDIAASEDNQSTCYICRYIRIKTEDIRFLKEKVSLRKN